MHFFVAFPYVASPPEPPVACNDCIVCACLHWALHVMPNCLEFCPGNTWEHCTANALDMVTCPFICAGISVLQMGYLHGTPSDLCAVVKKLCDRSASWTPHPQASLKIHVDLASDKVEASFQCADAYSVCAVLVVQN